MGTTRQKLGRRGERAAARLLKRQGYKILAKNLRAGRGELDLLARQGSLLVVVEVRYRSAGLLAADLSLDRKKELMILKTWQRLRRARRLPAGLPVRFDLILVGPKGAATHLPGVLGRGL